MEKKLCRLQFKPGCPLQQSAFSAEMTVCGKAQLTSLCTSTPHGTLLSSAPTNHTHTHPRGRGVPLACLFALRAGCQGKHKRGGLVSSSASGTGVCETRPLPLCMWAMPQEITVTVNEEALIISPFSNRKIVHPKIKILSCTHSQVVPNLCEFQKTVFWRMLVTKEFYLFLYYGSQWLPTTVWLPAFFKNLLFCSTEEINSYRYGTAWKWVNNDRI